MARTAMKARMPNRKGSFMACLGLCSCIKQPQRAPSEPRE